MSVGQEFGKGSAGWFRRRVIHKAVIRVDGAGAAGNRSGISLFM